MYVVPVRFLSHRFYILCAILFSHTSTCVLRSKYISCRAVAGVVMNLWIMEIKNEV